MSEAPCEVWFYHLERSTLDQVLPELLEKTLARGWRALVRTTATERLDHLDGWLWTWRDDSFLAHAVDGEPLAERAPIVLTAGPSNANRAQALFLIDGAQSDDLSAFERCILIFDGREPAALEQARAGWKAWRDAGHVVTYWRQGERAGWERQGG
jgi:DNA polymerase-3 subunit chi